VGNLLCGRATVFVYSVFDCCEYGSAFGCSECPDLAVLNVLLFALLDMAVHLAILNRYGTVFIILNVAIFLAVDMPLRPPLWSSGQSS
jgi:hypothetical protein